MTLQNLNKILERFESQLGLASNKQFELLKGLPFYDWSESKRDIAMSHRITTFNNTIGLPEKNGQSYSLFDYEQILFDILQTNKHVWIKKATGQVSLK